VKDDGADGLIPLASLVRVVVDIQNAEADLRADQYDSETRTAIENVVKHGRWTKRVLVEDDDWLWAGGLVRLAYTSDTCATKQENRYRITAVQADVDRKKGSVLRGDGEISLI
jgi:hypothetical protein